MAARSFVLGLLGVFVVGCGDDTSPVDDDGTNATTTGTGASGQGGAGGGEIPPPPSDNPIDVAVWPRLVSEGKTEVRSETNEKLCRRMALDFAGATPTPEEIAANCTGKTPAEMADAWMATDAFVARETKLWIQHLRLDPEK